MAKANPIRQATDEFLLQELAVHKNVTEVELVSIRHMLNEVRRLRPMTRTRAKLSAKQRAAVESRFKALGLDEGLKDRLLKLKGPKAVAALEPLAGTPERFLHPAKPPARDIKQPRVGMEFIYRESGMFGIVTSIDGDRVAYKDGFINRVDWTLDRIQVLP
jgi:hypothetical protein